MPCVYTTPAGLCKGEAPLSKNEHYFRANPVSCTIGREA
jgi:hypothetical protein